MVIAFLEVVVFYLELIALKAGGNPVGGSNDPLQKGLRFVMSRCGIDGGVRELAIACRYLERFAVTLQIGKMSCFLQFIPRDAGISRMQMTEPSARISKFLVMRAIELLVAVQRVRADLNFGSFGQFAQVVQEATECHAGSCVKHIRFIPSKILVRIFASTRAINDGKLAIQRSNSYHAHCYRCEVYLKQDWSLLNRNKKGGYWQRIFKQKTRSE